MQIVFIVTHRLRSFLTKFFGEFLLLNQIFGTNSWFLGHQCCEHIVLKEKIFTVNNIIDGLTIVTGGSPNSFELICSRDNSLAPESFGEHGSHW